MRSVRKSCAIPSMDKLLASFNEKAAKSKSKKNLDQYLSSLNREELQELFLKSAKNHFWEVSQAILNRPRFQATNPKSLIAASLELIKNDSPQEIVLQLVSSKQFSNLNVEEVKKLLLKAAAKGYREVIAKILTDPNFAALNSDDLAEILVEVVRNGKEEVADLIMSDPVMKDVSEYKRDIIKGAGEGGNLGILYTLLKDQRFDISHDDLKEALIEAAKHKNEEVFFAIMEYKIFQLRADDLGEILNAAAQSNLEIFKYCLEDTRVAKKITDRNLIDALKVAARADKKGIVLAILQEPKLVIYDFDVQEILSAANQNKEIVSAILKDSRAASHFLSARPKKIKKGGKNG